MFDETHKEDDEIELMDLFLVLWRRKWIIVGVVFFSMLIAFLFITFQQKKDLRTEMVISLNFEGIDKGLYPDGTVFDSKDIVSPDVLIKSDFDVDLSGYVFVEKIIPGHIKENRVLLAYFCGESLTDRSRLASVDIDAAVGL